MEKQAAYFEVGDHVLYGKYLNKKGVIKAFSTNEKGDPQVEIEPFPKGNKQVKVIKLFRLRKAPQNKTASNCRIAMRVAARWLRCTGS